MFVPLGTGSGCAPSDKDQPKVPLHTPQVQSALMSLSDDVMFSVADACAQVLRRTKRDDSRIMCASIRLGTAVGAISAATAQNPRVGLADLFTLVTLQRITLEEPRAADIFDEPDRRLLLDTFARAEETMDRVLSDHITEKEERELRELIAGWREKHPDRLGVTQVRLEEFATMRQAPRGDVGETASGAASTSILRLLRLDPMQGLDPATRQLYQSRLLAERVAFWGQRIPLVLGWQMEPDNRPRAEHRRRQGTDRQLHQHHASHDPVLRDGRPDGGVVRKDARRVAQGEGRGDRTGGPHG
jgi:hypothetical protein